MQINIIPTGNKFFVPGIYQLRHVFGSVPGARWNKPMSAWEYPLTPTCLYNVQASIEKQGNGLTFNCRDKAVELMIQATRRIRNPALLKPYWHVPHAFETQPWPHQLETHHFSSVVGGFATKTRGGAYLALDMGCGKSKCAIDLLNSHDHLKTAIIVCPNMIVDVWAGQDDEGDGILNEFQKHGIPDRQGWLGLKKSSIKKRTEMAQAFISGNCNPQKVLVINYEAIWREPFASWILSREWDLMVMDEAHRTKMPNGQVAKFLHRFSGNVKHIIGLSGTPMPHSPMDIFAQMRIIDPGVFGMSFTRFRSQYAVMGGFQNRQIVSFVNQEDMQEKLKPVMIRYKTEDVMTLPEMEDLTIPFDLSPAEKRAYQEMATTFAVQVQAGVITAANAAVKFLRLQQIASGSLEGIRFGASREFALMDVLQDMDDKEPVVVFCRFIEDLNAIERVAIGLKRGYSEISQRRKDLDAWKHGKTTILGAQIQTGKEGVDLTRARYSIYYSHGLGLGDYLQSRKRIHRPGQTRPVRYIHLVAKGTLDSRILRAFRDNHEAIEALLDYMRALGKEAACQKSTSAK